MKFSTVISCFILLLAPAMFTSCSSTPSAEGPMAPLADVYMKIANNNLAVSQAFQEISTTSQDPEESHEKAVALYEEMKRVNASLAEEAVALADKLRGRTIQRQISPALAVEGGEAVFTTVKALPQMADIVIEMPVENTPSEKTWVLFLNAEGTVVYKTATTLSNNTISVSIRMTTDKGSARNLIFVETEKLLFVTRAEYDAGGASPSPASIEPEAEKTLDSSNEEEYAEKNEPAYEGDDSGDEELLQSAVINGNTVNCGDNLVDVLKTGDKVTYEFNADSGILATVGNVGIEIDLSELSPEGLRIINGLTSDIELDVPLDPSCFKQNAKIQKMIRL